MVVLVSLRLTSDANMVTDVASMLGAVGAGHLHVFTDRPYRTELPGAAYHYLPKPLASLPGLRILFRFFGILWLAAKFRADVIVGYHMFSSGIPARLAGWLLRRPVVIYVLGKDLDREYHVPVIGSLLRFFLRRADGVTAQGERSRERLAALGVPVDVVSPVIDLARVPRDAGGERVDDLAFVGRFASEKRPDRFIEIVRELVKVRPGLRAVMVGAGPLEGEVRALAKAAGLDRHVTFTGWTAEVYRYLQDAKLYVLCSDNDQMPLTLIEAVACGCVPVVGRVGNVEDLVAPETGAVVDKDDVAAYASACQALLSEPDVLLRYREAGARVIASYSVEAGSTRWQQILGRLSRRRV
jgi:glycosyltransferase involved in cell wall biosynthesis